MLGPGFCAGVKPKLKQSSANFVELTLMIPPSWLTEYSVQLSGRAG